MKTRNINFMITRQRREYYSKRYNLLDDYEKGSEFDVGEKVFEELKPFLLKKILEYKNINVMKNSRKLIKEVISFIVDDEDSQAYGNNLAECNQKIFCAYESFFGKPPTDEGKINFFKNNIFNSLMLKWNQNTWNNPTFWRVEKIWH